MPSRRSVDAGSGIVEGRILVGVSSSREVVLGNIANTEIVRLQSNTTEVCEGLAGFCRLCCGFCTED